MFPVRPLNACPQPITQSTQSSEKGEGEKRPGTEMETDDPEEVGGNRRGIRTARNLRTGVYKVLPFDCSLLNLLSVSSTVPEWSLCRL
jgi:hypothetical protein